MGKKIDEWDGSKELADSIRRERVNQVCPEESWGGHVFDMEGQIMDAKIDDDNNLVVIMQFDHSSDHEEGWFELVLKPVKWRRSIPEAGKRKSRAKDVRADNRSRSRKGKGR